VLHPQDPIADIASSQEKPHYHKGEFVHSHIKSIGPLMKLDEYYRPKLAEAGYDLGFAKPRRVHQILLRYLAEKILRSHPCNFGEDCRLTTVSTSIDQPLRRELTI
jgi:hypothetical protein